MTRPLRVKDDTRALIQAEQRSGESEAETVDRMLHERGHHVPPAPPKIEHRVSALVRRVTSLEEDYAALADTVRVMRRAQVGHGLVLAAIAGHLGLPLPDDGDVDRALAGE